MQGGRKRRREGGILKDKNPRRSGRTKKFRGHTERSCCRLFFLFSLGWWGGNYIFAQQNTSLRVFIITIIIIIRRKIEVHARAGRQTKQEASASHQASRARITSQQQRQKQQAPLPGLEVRRNTSSSGSSTKKSIQQSLSSFTPSFHPALKTALTLNAHFVSHYSMASTSKATLILLIYGILMHYSVSCTPLGLSYPKIR